MNILPCLLAFVLFCAGTPKLTAQSPADTVANAMAFGLGSKMTLKLVKNTSGSYDYRVIQYEEFTDCIRIQDTNTLLSAVPQKETIEVIFAIGHYRDGNDKDDYKTVMFSRNNYGFPLYYDAAFQTPDEEQLQQTTVKPLLPGTQHMELWPFLIDYMALINYRASAETQ